ncbi:MAG: DUF2905 domain-containing protein [Firmicutes bacterium]|nr:DUF2905 domain-containing protein [Bacillota bacterium]
MLADSLGKILLITGGIIAAAGLLLLCLGRFGPGRLPGDILIQKENFSFYVPITTMLLVSIVLTILFNLIGRFR